MSNTIIRIDAAPIRMNVSAAQGPGGLPGIPGPNSVTSATTSDGTADLDLLNVDTVTATVTGTLTADHIHGNLAGNVYGHIRAGETLAKGDPVYVSGSHGSGSSLIPIVSKADASNAAKMPAVGIMDAGVTIHNNGHMVIVGTITELNTAGYTVNAELYVAAGGGFTATPPSARAQPVARVERANANNGAVIVKVNGLSASDATASTLVRRTANGDASFGILNTSGLTVTGGTTFGEESLVQFDAIEYYYGDGAASAHRIALGAGTTGAERFGAADAAAANQILGRQTVRKTVDENLTNALLGSRTVSTDFAADAQLFIPLEANTLYRIEWGLLAIAPNIELLKTRLTYPARDVTDSAGAAISCGAWGNSSPVNHSGGATGLLLSNHVGANQVRGNIGMMTLNIGATPGNLRVEWGKVAPGTGNTTMLKNSYLIATKIP